MITVIRRPVIKRCPWKDETDAGELVITIPGPAPELHELAAAVDALCEQPVSHEEFTAAVAALLPDDSLAVTTWNTGPWAVEVTESAKTREAANHA